MVGSVSKERQRALPSRDLLPKTAFTAEDHTGTTPASSSRITDRYESRQTPAPGTTEYLDDPAIRMMIAKLQARDMEVRMHEMAHIAAGGGVVRGGAGFSYQQGPDGKMYAIGGEVPIDMSGASTPEETIAKMERVRGAALAPANPSSADHQVAAAATMAILQARSELNASLKEKAPTKETNAG